MSGILGVLSHYDDGVLEQSSLDDLCVSTVLLCKTTGVDSISTDLEGSRYDVLSALADKYGLEIEQYHLDDDVEIYSEEAKVKAVREGIIEKSVGILCDDNIPYFDSFDNDINIDPYYDFSDKYDVDTAYVSDVQMNISDLDFDDDVPTYESTVYDELSSRLGWSVYSDKADNENLFDLQAIRDTVHELIDDTLSKSDNRFALRAKSIDFGEGGVSIKANMLTNLDKETEFVIPDSVFRMGENVFPAAYGDKDDEGKYTKIYSTRLHCSEGSAAEKYARMYDISWDDSRYRQGSMTISGEKLALLSEKAYEHENRSIEYPFVLFDDLKNRSKSMNQPQSRDFGPIGGGTASGSAFSEASDDLEY